MEVIRNTKNEMSQFRRDKILENIRKQANIIYVKYSLITITESKFRSCLSGTNILQRVAILERAEIEVVCVSWVSCVSRFFVTLPCCAQEWTY